MKLTVDIPEKDYKFIRDTYKETGLSFIPPAIKCECTEAVYNGTPYEERKTGKWIITKRNGVLCSECKSGTRKMPMLFGNPLYKYCPFCGIKMETDKEVEE